MHESATPFATLLEERAALLDPLGVNAGLRHKLAEYLERLWRQNRDLNLVSRKMTPDALVSDHLLDCLIALPFFPVGRTVADLGSGGGLPAIPLAICRPETSFWLFEKSPLKNKFLATLADLAPNQRRMGLLEPRGLPPEIDLIMARAFKPLPALLDLTRSYFTRGGAYLLFKGRLAKIHQELAESGLNESDPRVRIERLASAGSADERHLLLLNAPRP